MSVSLRALRLAPLLLGAASLVAGVFAGLVRMGLTVAGGAGPAPQHGPLMAVGFFGTLIGVERAVALSARGARWGFAAPLATGLGAALVLFGGAPAWGWSVAALGGALLAGVYVALPHASPPASAPLALRRLLWLIRWTPLVGAGGLAGGALLVATGAPVYRAVPAWMAFLILTVAAERLELSRFRPGSSGAGLFGAGSAALAVGAALAAMPGPGTGMAGIRLFAAGELVLAAWFARHDLAVRTVRRPGLPRLAGIAVIAGTAWLAVSGFLLAWHGLRPGAASYDAVLHSAFLGFAFGMVFAHAPVALPAILGVRLPFRRAFYGHVVLMHLALGVRLVADLAPGVSWSVPVRQVGGVGNAVAIALFAVVTAWSARAARR